MLLLLADPSRLQVIFFIVVTTASSDANVDQGVVAPEVRHAENAERFAARGVTFQQTRHPPCSFNISLTEALCQMQTCTHAHVHRVLKLNYNHSIIIVVLR